MSHSPYAADEPHGQRPTTEAARSAGAQVVAIAGVPILLGVLLLAAHRQNAGLREGMARPTVTGSTESRPRPAPLGSMAPTPLLRDPAGKLHRRFGEPGQPYVLAFMPTKRPPATDAQERFAELRALKERYAAAGIKVGLVTDVKPGELSRVAQRYRARIPIFADERGVFPGDPPRTARAFRVRSDFELFVVDRQGNLAFHQVSVVDVGDSPLIRFLDQLAATSGNSR